MGILFRSYFLGRYLPTTILSIRLTNASLYLFPL